jgi:hypothetical protein
MDTKIHKAIELSEYRATLSNQIQNLKYQTKTKLIYSTNGGSFNVTPELIGFVFAMKDAKELVILDSSETPIHIDNPKVFLKEIKKLYTTITSKAESEYTKLRNARKTENISNVNLGE